VTPPSDGPDRGAGPRRPPRPGAPGEPVVAPGPATPPAAGDPAASSRGAGRRPRHAKPDPAPAPSPGRRRGRAAAPPAATAATAPAPDGAARAAAPETSRVAGSRPPIPDAPGPRPERRPARARGARPGAKASAVTFRTPREVAPATAPTAPVAPTPAPAPAPAPAGRAPGSRSREARPERPTLPAPPSPRSAFRQRYGVVYDTQGPRIRLALLWVVLVAVALGFRPLRPFGLATLYAMASGLAAMQVVDAWHSVRAGADRWVAAAGASAMPVLATLGVRPLGGVLLLTVVGAVLVAAQDRGRETPLFAAAGHTVLAAGACGGAAAALVLLADYEIGAVIILITYLMVYDASDYVVGSGATNGVEGPLAGGISIAAVTMLFAVVDAPPFNGVDIWSFAMLAVVACPAGQLLGSAMLPRADARAPALRRIDSLLLVAPAWAGLVGLYLQRAGS
jgi:hypothetical protein